MSRGSQTDLAVLGALAHAPMTGYEVRATIKETIGHFWSESFGQIYPALARLEADDCIRRDGGGQTSGSTFAITEAGLARLREGLLADAPPHRPRNALLFRLFLGRHLPPSRVQELIDEAAAQATGAEERYRVIEAEIRAEPAGLDRELRLATVRYGLHMARAQADWAAETRDTLARRPRRPRPAKNPDRMTGDARG